MATTIDSLIVTLGLDASKFTAGQKAAVAALKQTSDEARARGKEIEDSSRRSSAFFSRLRGEAVGLFATLAGARGIKEFIANTTSADAELGRFSRNINVSVPTIAKWKAAAELAGGSAKEMATTFLSLSDTFTGWRAGVVSPLVADLRAISTAGGTIIDVNKGVEQSLLDLEKNLRAIHARDPAMAGFLGRRAGIDPATYDIMIQGKMRETLALVEKIGVATQKDTEQAAELSKQWNSFALAVQNIGRRSLNSSTTFLSAMFESWTAFFSGDKPDRAKMREIGRRDLFGFGSGGLPLKAGATSGGDTSLGIWALAHTLGPDVIKRISATNDLSHSGGKHRDGLAMDFTINDPRRSAEIASKLRARLGDDATVLDEYLKPSKNATGPHIHVQFNSPEAAQRFAAAAGTPSGPASTATTDVRIGTINVNTQASDAAGIARDLPAAIRERQSLGGLGNVTGSQ